MSASTCMDTREAFETRSGIYEFAPFGRVMTAVVTPFDKDGKVDLDMAVRLAKYLEQNGSEGLVLAGTTGEAPTLRHEEQLDLFRAVWGEVEIPILAGTGSNNTAEAIELTETVTEEGIADGVLLVEPYYNKPSQEGITEHFLAVGIATDLPILLYDIPGRTGRETSVYAVKRLAALLPNLVGIKDAAGSEEKSQELFTVDSDEFVVYSGDDARNLKLYQAGAVGCISVASHWAGREIAAMFDAVDVEDMTLAEMIDLSLQPSYKFETSDFTPNPSPAKAMMRELGIDVGRERLPITVGSDLAYRALERKARRVYDNLQADMQVHKLVMSELRDS